MVCHAFEVLCVHGRDLDVVVVVVVGVVKGWVLLKPSREIYIVVTT